MTTLGELSGWDTFTFEPGGPRWTAHPELPAAVDVPVSRGDEHKRAPHKTLVFDVRPAARIVKASPDDIGQWIAGSSLRTADELNALIIEEAHTRGMPAVQDDLDMLRDYWREGGHANDPEIGDGLASGADQAISWMNRNIMPDGFRLELSDGLVMWPNEEEED